MHPQMHPSIVYDLTFTVSSRSTGGVALLEMPATGGSSSRPVTWPFLASTSSYLSTSNSPTSSAAWAVNLKNDAAVAKLVQVLTGSSVYVPDILGKPGETSVWAMSCPEVWGTFPVGGRLTRTLGWGLVGREGPSLNRL